MSNCIIEGNFDFYKELYESLDDSDDNNMDELSTQVCLISNTPLTKHFVELECKHAFNYVPLFKDLVNHKTKFSSLDTHRLKVNEIRCPYCRNKQKKLLPFYENIVEVKKIHGINWIDETVFYSFHEGKCQYIYPTVVDHDMQCQSTYVKKFSDEKTYCFHHYKMMGKIYAKEAQKKAKLLAKEEMKKEKMEWKQKEKLEKQEKQKKQKENVVLGVLSESLCQVILKSGPRQGHLCGLKVTKENMCTRHCNLQKKTTKIKVD